MIFILEFNFIIITIIIHYFHLNSLFALLYYFNKYYFQLKQIKILQIHRILYHTHLIIIIFMNSNKKDYFFFKFYLIYLKLIYFLLRRIKNVKLKN